MICLEKDIFAVAFFKATFQVNPRAEINFAGSYIYRQGFLRFSNTSINSNVLLLR